MNFHNRETLPVIFLMNPVREAEFVTPVAVLLIDR